MADEKTHPTYAQLVAKVERLERNEKRLVEWSKTLGPIFKQLEDALNDLATNHGRSQSRAQILMEPFISLETKPDGSPMRPIEGG